MSDDERHVHYVLTVIQAIQAVFTWLLIFASCVNSESMGGVGKINYFVTGITSFMIVPFAAVISLIVFAADSKMKNA